MTGSRPEERSAVQQSRLRLSTIFLIEAIVFVALTMIGAFVNIAATACTLFMDATSCHLMQTMWAPLIWAGTFGLLAACAIATCVITGLILCVRPASFNTQSSALYIQHWPRQSGLTLVWAGLGIMIFSIFLALHPPDFTSTTPLDLGSILGRMYVACAVIYGPLFVLGVCLSLWCAASPDAEQRRRAYRLVLYPTVQWLWCSLSAARWSVDESGGTRRTSQEAHTADLSRTV